MPPTKITNRIRVLRFHQGEMTQQQLATRVGVTRQTSVLAYQFGDGFSNIFTPTCGYFMAGLALIKVSWTRWVKFLWPLQLLWLGAGLVLLLIAHAIRWGPF